MLESLRSCLFVSAQTAKICAADIVASTCRTDVRQMSVNDLGTLLGGEGAERQRLQLIDVREDGEYAAASLPGFQLLPLSRLVCHVIEGTIPVP